MSSNADSSRMPALTNAEIKQAVEDATLGCTHFKERYGKCCKNWEKTSLMRGGDMRYACEEFYDDFRACIIETLADRGIHDVPFFGVATPGFSTNNLMSEEKEQPSTNGYTYWKREIPDAHVLPSCEPRKIDKSSSEESLVDSLGEKKLMSRWNSGTTYEERNITERAKKLLSVLLDEIDHPRLTFSQSSFSGEVHAHAVRGKVKIGYELTELKLSMTDSAASDCGSIEIEDLDSTDPDAFILTLVNGKGDILKSEAKALVIQLMTDMCTRLLAE